MIFLLILLFLGTAYADEGIISTGSSWPTYADVSVDNSCEQVLARNLNSRKEIVVCNTGATNDARCGGSGVTSSRGVKLLPGGCAVLETSALVSCCSTSGTTIAPSEVTR